MEKLKSFGRNYLFEFTALAAFSAIYVINSTYIALPNAFTIAAQFIFASLLAGKFIKSFADESKRNACFFAACFAIYFMVAYNYSLFSLATVDVAHGIGFAAFAAAAFCLSDERIALLALPLSAAGVIASKDFAVLSLPSLVVASAFADGGIFAMTKNEQHSKKNKKRQASFAPFNKFLAPALLAIGAITAAAYIKNGNAGYGLIFADYGYILMNRKYLYLLVPVLFIITAVWFKTLKSKKNLTAFICSVIACLFTIAGAYLFDFSLILFKFYLLNAVFGLFAGTMIIAARSKQTAGGLKESISALSPAVVCSIIVITFLYLPAARSYLTK